MPGYSIADDVQITAPNKYQKVPQKTPDERSWKAFFLDFFGFANDSRIEIGETETASVTLFDRAFLPKPFGLLGLIYLARLATDVGSLFGDAAAIYSEEKEKQKANAKENQHKASFFAALQIAARQDRQRISRIFNDLVWSAVNLTCLIANPVAAMVMTIIGVTFDVIHQSVLFARDMRHFKELEKLNEQLRDLKESHADKAQIKALKQEIKDFKKTYNLQDEKQLVIKNRLGVLGLVLLFSVGCALTLFPPTAFFGGIMVGASAAIGITKLLSAAWDLTAKWFGGRKQADKTVENANTQENKPEVLLSPSQRNALEAQKELAAQNFQNPAAAQVANPALSSSAQVFKQTGANIANVIAQADQPATLAKVANEAIASKTYDSAQESEPLKDYSDNDNTDNDNSVAQTMPTKFAMA